MGKDPSKDEDAHSIDIPLEDTKPSSPKNSLKSNEPHQVNATLESQVKNVDSSSATYSGAFWLGCWFLLNIGLTIMNKALFEFSRFGFPLALSMVHMLFSAILSKGTTKYMAIPTKVLSQKDEISVALFSVLFCANIMVGNLCLQYVSVSLVQVVRSVIPGITLILSMFFLGKRYDKVYFYTIGLVVLGVGMASYGEVNFSTKGFIFTILVCFLSSLKSVLSSKFLVGNLKFHPFDLLYRMSTYAVVQLFLGVIIFEREDIMEWWSTYGDWRFTVLLSFNGLMAFLLNWCNFMTTKMTSALTVTVAGNVKHITTIAFSIVIFNNPISLMNAAGTFITVIGAGYYSWLELKK